VSRDNCAQKFEEKIVQYAHKMKIVAFTDLATVNATAKEKGG
jgi:hypothetical protein